MMQTSTERSFIASVAIPAGARVKYIGNNQVALADLGEVEIGTAKLQSGKDSYAQWDTVAVKLRLPATTFRSAKSFVDGAVLRRAANGTVSDTGDGAPCAIAVEAASAGGEWVEAIPLFAHPLAPTEHTLLTVNGEAAGAADLAGLKTATEKHGDDIAAIYNALVSHGILIPGA